jgi:hypothetical protein
MSVATEPWRYLMGRASNRKKAQRQAGPGSRQARPDPRPSAVPPQLAFVALVAVLMLMARRLMRGSGGILVGCGIDLAAER